MALKYREEIVGKRFLCIATTHGRLKFSKIADWQWRAGIVRAASHKDPKHPELTVLVEFDDVDWKRREWIRVYEPDVFQVFLVEQSLIWSLRKDCPGNIKNHRHWPALNFKPLIDNISLFGHKIKPVEYLVDKRLDFVDYSELKSFQDVESETQQIIRDFPEARKAIRQWSEFQDGQRILLTTPSVLVGYRVKVYRAEGTTQWYTAVIVSYNDNTRELTLTDDTVLEEHNEDPCLVQMKLIGDGVVESILKGENIGITPRRRTCTLTNQRSTGHYTRAPSPVVSKSTSSRPPLPRKTRSRASPVHSSTPQEKARQVCVRVSGDRKRKNSGGGNGFTITTDCRITLKKVSANPIYKKTKEEPILPNTKCITQSKPDKVKQRREKRVLREFSENSGSEIEPEETRRCQPKTLGKVSKNCQRSHAKEVAALKDVESERKKSAASDNKLNCVSKEKLSTKNSKSKTFRSCRSRPVKSSTARENNESPEQIFEDANLDSNASLLKNSDVIFQEHSQIVGSDVPEEPVDASLSLAETKPCVQCEKSSDNERNVVAAPVTTESESKENHCVPDPVKDEFRGGVIKTEPGVHVGTSENCLVREEICSSEDRTESTHDGVSTPQGSLARDSSVGLGMCSVGNTRDNSSAEKTNSSKPNSPLNIDSVEVEPSGSSSPTKEDSNSNNNPPVSDKSERDSSPLVLDKHAPVKVYRDPLLVNSETNVRHIESIQHRLMHPAGLTHSAAAAAAAVYPRVPNMPPQTRAPSAPLPPTPLAHYGLSAPHLLPPHHAGPPAPHIEQQSLSYRHIVPSHLMHPQYTTPIEMVWPKYPHLPAASPNPWVMAQYQEEQMRLGRALAQERDRQNRIEREKKEEKDRFERERQDKERLEREKVEKERERERQEREQREKERSERERQERERQERERLDREERERAQREVQQHFEESLRLANQKRSVGWSPISSLPLSKSVVSGAVSERNSPVVSHSIPSRSINTYSAKEEKMKEADSKDSLHDLRSRQEQERWMAMMQQQQQQQHSHREQVHPHSSHASQLSSYEQPSAGIKPKIEAYSSSHSSVLVNGPAHASTKASSVSTSPVVMTTSSGGIHAVQPKVEHSFSLYGYQPFQHTTFITKAQLKATEEGKSSNPSPHTNASGSRSSHVLPNHHITEKECHMYESSGTSSGRNSTPLGRSPSLSPKQLKMMHVSQPERVSPLYQPIGTGGAFKPYEYTPASPAPAHQNSSSPSVSSRVGTPHLSTPPLQQEQPQNLVKGDNKSESLHQRYDVTKSVPAGSAPAHSGPHTSFKTSSPACAPYSYSLIQQGLVPNPMYTAAPVSGSPTPATLTTSTMTTTSCSRQSGKIPSPVLVNSYARPTQMPGITTGSPICRPNSISYQELHSKGITSYSPPNSVSQPPPSLLYKPVAEMHPSLSTGSHSSSHHASPSPAQPASTSSFTNPSFHSGTSSIPCSTHSSPYSSGGNSFGQLRSSPPVLPPSVVNPNPIDGNGQQPLNLQNSAGASPTKRKLPKEATVRKRQKSIDDASSCSQPSPQGGNLPPSSSSSVTPSASYFTKHYSSPPSSVPESIAISGLTTNLNGGCTTSAGEGGGKMPPTSPPLPQTSSSSSVPPPNTGFLESFRSFVTSSQSGQDRFPQYYNKHNKGRNKSSQNIEDGETGNSQHCASNNDSGALALNVAAPLDIDTDSRVTPSPALSTGTINSSVSTVSGGGSASTTSTNHTKLKKAWLQRHSDEDKNNPDPRQTETAAVAKVVSSNNDSASDNSSSSVMSSTIQTAATATAAPASQLVDSKNSKTSENCVAADKADGTPEDDGSSSTSETEPSKTKSIKRKTRSTRKRLTSGRDGSKRQKANTENQEESVGEEGSSSNSNSSSKDKDDQNSSSSSSGKKKSVTPDRDSNSRRRGRKPKGRSGGSDDSNKKKAPRPFEKPSLARLKRTGEPFLQDGPCCEVAPKLPKCRECRMTPNQRSKKMPNIFCRFYAFRKLRYGKNGTILSAGFSEPSDATEDDLKLWLPPVDNPPADMDVDTSKFLLTHVGDQFCDLVEQEREAQSLHMSDDTTITWKRVVQGVREMCDVCETTLFNIHWVCHKCGFVVCIDCYKARKNGTVKEEDSPPKDRDEFQWLLCTNRQPHEQEKLMLTQIIAGSALWDVGRLLHDVRRAWNIPLYCSCTQKGKGKENSKRSSNGICKQLMSAVSKCFSNDKEQTSVNGLSDGPRSSKKSPKGSMNGTVALVKQEESLAGYSSESGGSPLSWLADVALNSSSKLQEDGSNAKEGAAKKEDGGSGEDAEEKGGSFSTLRELLIRPTGKGGKGGCGHQAKKSLASTLDEVISCVIEQGVGKGDKKDKEEKQLMHFTRRYPQTRTGREPLPIRVCTLAESTLLYPDVPHSWLCNGRLLLLLDPLNEGNLRLFQEQWRRGQPVVVADVSKRLDMNLWHPDGFCKDFGDVRNDLVNCKTGVVLPNLPMRKFWEGFENFSKRMKEEDGDYMLLKLKDWPPGEDFSELLPSRYRDLMTVLPLPQYTHRDGLLNLAGRLPECFVRPDLGPKMYNAYGSALYPTKGTTNLHLDISDAVNLMVYVGIPKDGKDEEHIQEALRAIDEGGCDSIMRKRVREKGIKPGALWHIYNARDADKIRDLLNKVAVERGEKLEPHHDPIHDQSWYLDEDLRNRLYREYAVEGYAIAQCLGDAVFIPAGAPHQVRNLHSCIKVAEDFVSPENVSHCFNLTQEFRHLSDTHTNHEDKLQIKNIIYHAVKDALALLEVHHPNVSVSS